MDGLDLPDESLQSSSWGVYKDAFAPKQLRPLKAWERAPVDAHVPRLRGKVLWKKAGIRGAHEDKENDDSVLGELGTEGLGSRKRVKLSGTMVNLSDAQWKDMDNGSSAEPSALSIKESPKKTGALSLGVRNTDALLVPRKRTNENHLITPRKSNRNKRPAESTQEMTKGTAFEASSPKPSRVRLRNDAIPNTSSGIETSARRRKSMRKSSRRITLGGDTENASAKTPAVTELDAPLSEGMAILGLRPNIDVMREIVGKTLPRSPTREPAQHETTDPAVSASLNQGAIDMGEVVESHQEAVEDTAQNGERSFENGQALDEEARNPNIPTEQCPAQAGTGLTPEPRIDHAIFQLVEPDVHLQLSLTKSSSSSKFSRTTPPQGTRRSSRTKRSSSSVLSNNPVSQLAEAPLTQATSFDTPCGTESEISSVHQGPHRTIEDNRQAAEFPHAQMQSPTKGEVGISDTEDMRPVPDREITPSGVFGNFKLPAESVASDTLLLVEGAQQAAHVVSIAEDQAASYEFRSVPPQAPELESDSHIPADDSNRTGPAAESALLEHVSQFMASDDSSDGSLDDLDVLRPTCTTEIENFTGSLPGSSTPDPTTTELVETISENAIMTYDYDDTDLLRNFLTRVKANKAAKAVTGIPKRKRSLPHSPIQLPLYSVEGQISPSSPKFKDECAVSLAAESPTKRQRASEPEEAANVNEQAALPKSIRRSGRTRLPVKAPLAAPSFIPVRRLGQDGDSTVTLKRSNEKELAALTRANTRKNKGAALHPADVLAKNMEEKENPASRQRALKDVFDEKIQKKKQEQKKRKSVVWAEELVHFHSEEIKTPIIENEPEKAKERGSAAEEKKKSVKVGMRSKMGLGMAANGTPASKRKMRGRS